MVSSRSRVRRFFGVLVADLVGVFAKAGQQNLTEWLKGVMKSYESGGVILDISYEPGGVMCCEPLCVSSRS